MNREVLFDWIDECFLNAVKSKGLIEQGVFLGTLDTLRKAEVITIEEDIFLYFAFSAARFGNLFGEW